MSCHMYLLLLTSCLCIFISTSWGFEVLKSPSFGRSRNRNRNRNIKSSFRIDSSESSESSESSSYEYISCGDKLRLESFGGITVLRSCPTANKPMTSNFRDVADLVYEGSSGKEGEWNVKSDAKHDYLTTIMDQGSANNSTNWIVNFDNNLVFDLCPAAMGQVGVFPEQQENWKWIRNVSSSSKS